MKSLVILSVIALIAAAVAEAEDSESKPSPTPGLISSEIEEPALPTSESTPGEGGPTLLPESDELPASPRAEQPTSASMDRASPKPSARERARFNEVQSMAMSYPRAAYLLKRARNSSSAAARRTYLRAYYSAVAARMRKLDPDLKLSIDAYEEAKVHQEAGSAIPRSRSSHRSRSHRIGARELHHGSRRVTAHRRYQRMLIIYDPYGPDMPPYGPPVVFDPW